MTKPTAEEIQRAAEDPIFFIERFCKTFDPRTFDKNLDFKLYDYQKTLVLEMKDAIEGGYDLFIEKSRDMGVSWVALCVFTWFWFFRPDFQALLGSRKEDYVDNGTIQSLFGKIDYLLQWMQIKPEGFSSIKNRTYMKLVSPKSKSVIQGESANPNFSRAARNNAILYDEIAFWQNQEQSWEAGADSSPCRIAITTPSSDPSYARAIRNSGKVKVITLHWRLHPHKTEEWYQKECLRRPAEAIARELDINWEGSLEGIIFTEIQQVSLSEYPYIVGNKCYASWDFGLDGTSIGWWQINPTTGKKRRIDTFFKTNKTIHYFLPFFGRPIDSTLLYAPEDIEMIERSKLWTVNHHFGDPDVEKRGYQTKYGTSTRQILQENGIYVETRNDLNDIHSRIEITKELLLEGIEVNDTPGNRLWLEAMKGYRYPKRDENSQSTSPNIIPVHDWCSHLATETQYFAVNIKKLLDTTSQSRVSTY